MNDYCRATLRYAEWSEPSGLLKETSIDFNPDATQQWSVSFDVLLGDWVIGTDRGILWVDEQNVYLVGELTSFAIPGHRISDSVQMRSQAIRPLQRKFFIVIKGDPTLPVSVQVDVAMIPPFVPENIAFLEAVRNCRNRSNPEIEGQLPPIRAGKNAHARSDLEKMLFNHSVRTAGLLILCLACVALVEADLRLNPLLALLILAALGFQVWLWAGPRIALARSAIRGLRLYG